MPRPLTWLRFQLIKTVLELKDEAYTNAVRRALNASHRADYELGPIHTTLDRMREAGLVSTYHREGVTTGDGSVRTVVVYEVTDLGAKSYAASKPFHESGP